MYAQNVLSIQNIDWREGYSASKENQRYVTLPKLSFFSNFSTFQRETVQRGEQLLNDFRNGSSILLFNSTIVLLFSCLNIDIQVEQSQKNPHRLLLE